MIQYNLYSNIILTIKMLTTKQFETIINCTNNGWYSNFQWFLNLSCYKISRRTQLQWVFLKKFNGKFEYLCLNLKSNSFEMIEILIFKFNHDFNKFNNNLIISLKLWNELCVSIRI